MITHSISKNDYQKWMKFIDNEKINVAHLDGNPILGGFAKIEYDQPEQSGYSLFYETPHGFLRTFVRLKDPVGNLVGPYEDIDFDATYEAVRPGRYADNQTTFDQFKNLKKSIPLNRKTIARLPLDLREAGIKWERYQEALRYPGDIYALAQKYPGEKVQYTYLYEDAEPFEEDFHTDDLAELENTLFDMFMLNARSF